MDLCEPFRRTSARNASSVSRDGGGYEPWGARHPVEWVVEGAEVEG